MGLKVGQIACVAVILLGILTQLIGFCAPYWAKAEILGRTMSCGLWYYCEDVVGETQCDPYTWTENYVTSYYVSFYAVHLCVGIATLLSIVIVVLFVAKLRADDKRATSVGVCGVICGVLGIIAAAVFFGLPDKSLNLYYWNFQPQSFVFNYNKRFAEYEADWAAIVYAVGSGLMLLCSVIFFFIPSSDSVDVRHN